MTKKTQSQSENNTLLLGFPGGGLVGVFTISYLIPQLKMTQIGEIDHPDIVPTLFVENGELYGPIRIYKKDDLYAILSDVPFDLDLGYSFAESVIEFAKKNHIKKIIIPSGMESPTKDPKAPKVYGLVTHQSLESLLYQNDIPKFLTGTIMGTDAAMVATFRKSNIPVALLYTECHPFFPDPEAALHAITIIAKIFKFQIDTTDIKNRIEYLRIQNRKLMEETLAALQMQPEGKPAPVPHIYR